MNSLALLQGASWGILMGLYFFGGLLLTVRKLPYVRRPGRFLLLSFFGRFSLTAFCFWIILRQDLISFAVALLFFLTVRIVFTRLFGRPSPGGIHADQP